MHVNNSSTNTTDVIKCLFPYDVNHTQFLMVYYLISLLIQLMLIFIMVWQRRVKVLPAKFSLIFFVTNCCILMVYIINSLFLDKQVGGARCLFLTISYGFHSITTKLAVSALIVIIRLNMSKLKSLRRIETPSDREVRSKTAIRQFSVLAFLSFAEALLTILLHSKLLLGIGLIYQVALNVSALISAYKAYKLNTRGSNENDINEAAKQTMLKVQKFQRATLLMALLTAGPMLLRNIFFTFAGSEFGAQLLSKSTRQIFTYIGRIYVFTISIEAILYMYYNHRDFFQNGNTNRVVAVENDTKRSGEEQATQRQDSQPQPRPQPQEDTK